MRIRNSGITLIVNLLTSQTPEGLLDQIGLVANRAWQNNKPRVAPVAN
jgi:hypothetical protein